MKSMSSGIPSQDSSNSLRTLSLPLNGTGKLKSSYRMSSSTNASAASTSRRLMASYMPLTTDSAVTSAAAARTACRPGRREGKVEGRRGEHLTRGVPTPAGGGRDDGVTDGDVAARRAAVARVDRAATAGRAHTPTANETDIP